VPFKVKPEMRHTATGTAKVAKRHRKTKKTAFFVNFKTSSHLPDFLTKNIGRYVIKLGAVHSITHISFYKSTGFAIKYTKNKISHRSHKYPMVVTAVIGFILKKWQTRKGKTAAV
jgi:hypothetical protein